MAKRNNVGGVTTRARHPGKNAKALAAREAVKEFRTKLLKSSTYGKLHLRSLLNQQVRDFHQKFSHPIGLKPGVPNDAELIRFRLRLITEEFFELLSACEIWPSLYISNKLDAKEVSAKEIIFDSIKHDFADPDSVNLPELIDALGDMDYVNDGFRVVCGVDGGPVADAIHAANMNKTPNGDDKPTKNKGWRAPDIKKELKKQGWVQR